MAAAAASAKKRVARVIVEEGGGERRVTDLFRERVQRAGVQTPTLDGRAPRGRARCSKMHPPGIRSGWDGGA